MAVVLAPFRVAVAAYAAEEPVPVDVRRHALPCPTLSLAGSSQDVTAVPYRFRPASALERSRGFIENENALRFRVVSDTPRCLQGRWENPSGKELPEVDVREHGRGHATLGDPPIVLCSGSNGEALLICTIMPDQTASIRSDGLESRSAGGRVLRDCGCAQAPARGHEMGRRVLDGARARVLEWAR